MAFRWLQYWLHAVDQHSLQAPFIYSFYENVVRRNPDPAKLLPVVKLKQQLLGNKSSISVTDFGAGGKRSKQRSVSIIAKSSNQPKVSRLLFNSCSYLQPATILELGTSLGLSTLHMALAIPLAKVVTLEGCQETSKLANGHFNQLGVTNVELVTGEISQTLPQVLSGLVKIDFLFMDANHRYKPTIEYYHQCQPKFHEQTVVIIDDINWSGEMQKAWRELKSLSQVSLSVDLFKVGILFFKPNFNKTHFTLSW